MKPDSLMALFVFSLIPATLYLHGRNTVALSETAVEIDYAKKGAVPSSEEIASLRGKVESPTVDLEPAQSIDAKEAEAPLPKSESNEINLESQNVPAAKTTIDPPCANPHEGAHPICVTVSSQHHYDLLGSYMLPHVYLSAIAFHYNYTHQIYPYKGSKSENILKGLFQQGDDLKETWKASLPDANKREGYDPMQVNAVAHDTVGFFPKQVEKQMSPIGRITVTEVPVPGQDLEAVCGKAPVEDGYIRCNLWFAADQLQDTWVYENHFRSHGGVDVFFDPAFRNQARAKFLDKNSHRVKHYPLSGTVEAKNLFTVAIHVRRGEVSELQPEKMIRQETYAAVAQRICKQARESKGLATQAHIFSAGVNPDGSFSVLEGISAAAGGDCGSVAFHLDEYEFDTWAHFVAADAFILSKSTYSHVPALLSAGEVHAPQGYHHAPLSHWKLFNVADGADASK